MAEGIGRPLIGPNGEDLRNWGDDGWANGAPLTLEEYTNMNKPSETPKQPTNSMDELWKLAQSDPAYMEVYLQNLAERENTTQAQKWYENMSNTAMQRQMMDLKKAGLNPWLAVQNLSGAGSGSVSPAGTSSLSPYQQKVQKELGQKQNDLKAVQIAGSIATSIMLMAMMLI